MAIQVSETLQRKIGPLPAWGWGAAIGGGLLAFKVLRGGSLMSSGQPTATQPTESSDVPVTSGTGTTTTAGPAGPTGPAGPAGTNAPTAPARPRCDIAGWANLYDPVKNAWQTYGINQARPAYPTDPTKEVFWSKVGCVWGVWLKTELDKLPQADVIRFPSPVVPPAPSPVPTVVADGGAKGPGILSSALGGGPVIDRSDIGTAYLAPPDFTPKSGGVIPKLNPLPGMPVVASIPDVDGGANSRAPYGRPFYDN